jgi:hypothetical protein
VVFDVADVDRAVKTAVALAALAAPAIVSTMALTRSTGRIASFSVSTSRSPP